MKNFLTKHVPLPLLYRAARVYWFFRRPYTVGAKAVLRNSSGEILLVRHTYQRKSWTFPGGGLERGEDARTALAREIREELGLSLEAVVFKGAFENRRDFKKDKVFVYEAEVQENELRPDSREILETTWRAPEDLPNLPENARRILDIALTN